MNATPTISVIIVSYNTRAMTLECLRALYADVGGMAAEVWVVDNASADGSVEAVRAEFTQVRVIANDKNVGFGAANNQAMREAAGRYLLLLNSDAFPRPGAVAAMVDFLDRRPEAGLVGPRLLNKDGSLQRSCFPFPSPARAWLENLWISAVFPDRPKLGDYRRWAHDSEREVDWLIGACMLVRREVLERVGGFDERFFMYAEESDWQRRMRDAGWKVLFTPAAEVVHLGGASGANEKAKINRHFFESLDYYEYKHHGVLGLVSLRAAMTVGCFIRTILWTGVLLFVPGRRAVAASKAKLLSWLFVRQMTHWPRFS
jgi:GT2 family glycosyltransferase